MTPDLAFRTNAELATAVIAGAIAPPSTESCSMTDVARIHVTHAPRETTTSLFSAADLGTALERVRARAAPGTTRLAIWTDAPAPAQEPDVVVCVPVTLLDSRRAHAEEVVARWDAAWLVIESMPSAHRNAARQHLVDEISIALLASAIEGVSGLPVADDPGFDF